MKCHGIVFVLLLCLIGQGLQNKIIFSAVNNIKEKNLITGEVSYLITNLQSDIFCIDYDYNTGYLYIPRFNKHDILRLRYPSEKTYNIENVTMTNSPVNLAIDTLYKHVYWSEYNNGNLLRCNLDGSNKSFILHDSIGYMYALTLDIQNRWLYYSTVSLSYSIRLRRARLDGTEIQTLIESAVSPMDRVIALSIDNNEDRLYWMGFDRGDLKSSNFNGTNVIDVHRTNTIRLNRAIHLYGNTVYCVNDRQILDVTVSPSTTVNVIHSDIETMYAQKEIEVSKNVNGWFEDVGKILWGYIEYRSRMSSKTDTFK
ncbi:LRP8 [Mytilus coruscus]|uniref:LRP8 n=1 Tax=Mytilus coruscus TaxID=42192 RepID=A0A6J8A7Y7_MYTCO|nr:LRP8 [Mytilus coruscus]